MPKYTQNRVRMHDTGDFRTSDGQSYSSLAAANAAQSRLDKGMDPTPPAKAKAKEPKTWDEARDQQIAKERAKDRAAAVADIDPATRDSIIKQMQRDAGKVAAERAKPKTLEEKRLAKLKQQEAERKRNKKLEKVQREALYHAPDDAETARAKRLYGSSTPRDQVEGITERDHARAVDRQNDRTPNPNKPQPTVN